MESSAKTRAGFAPALAPEGEQVRGGELPVARAVQLVEARVEEAEGHVLPLEQELLAGRDGHAAGEGLPVAAHRGRGVDEQVVDALLLVAALLAGEVEHLVVGDAPHQLEVVPGQLGEHHAVDRPARAQARVAVRGALPGGRAGLGLEHAGEDLQREVHDVVGLRRLQRGEQIDLRQRARRDLGPEHAEEPERVEIERVGHGQDEEAPGLERAERRRPRSRAASPRRARGAAGPGRRRGVASTGTAGRYAGADGGARGDRAEEAREDHDDQIVVHLELRGAPRGLALAQLGERRPVHLHEARQVPRPGRRERLQVDPRPDAELLARRREEQADVVHEAERQTTPRRSRPSIQRRARSASDDE